MSVRKKTFRDFYYFIIDDDTKLYNYFIPDCPSHQWNLKVIEEQEKGKNMRAMQYEIEKLDDVLSWLNSIGFSESKTLLVGVAYNNTREYTKRIPDYAKDADLNKVLIINCHFCKGKWGELNTIYPGMDTLHKAEPNIYTARCLTCKREVNDNYNWYRDDKTND